MDITLLEYEWHDLRDYARKYLNSVQEDYFVLWGKLFNCVESKKWSNILPLLRLFSLNRLQVEQLSGCFQVSILLKLTAGIVLVNNGWMICLEYLWTVLPFASGILAVPFRCGGKKSNVGQRKGERRHVLHQEQSPFNKRRDHWTLMTGKTTLICQEQRVLN